jgi:hypothetical protein
VQLATALAHRHQPVLQGGHLTEMYCNQRVHAHHMSLPWRNGTVSVTCQWDCYLTPHSSGLLQLLCGVTPV